MSFVSAVQNERGNKLQDKICIPTSIYYKSYHLHALQTWTVPSYVIILTSPPYIVKNDWFPSQFWHNVGCRLKIIVITMYGQKLREVKSTDLLDLIRIVYTSILIIELLNSPTVLSNHW